MSSEVDWWKCAPLENVACGRVDIAWRACHGI
jgi:hypothetical protein